MQFSRKRFAVGASCLMCLTVVLMALLSGRASSQNPVQNPVPSVAEIGRYQIIPAGGGLNPYVYFLDTKTGQCWLADTPGASTVKGGWQRIPSPVFPAGKPSQ